MTCKMHGDSTVSTSVFSRLSHFYDDVSLAIGDEALSLL
jgi:hypothetical protein